MDKEKKIYKITVAYNISYRKKSFFGIPSWEDSVESTELNRYFYGDDETVEKMAMEFVDERNEKLKKDACYELYFNGIPYIENSRNIIRTPVISTIKTLMERLPSDEFIEYIKDKSGGIDLNMLIQKDY